MRTRYAIALTILGAYFIASYFVLHAAIEHQRSLQRIVAVSVQQRMYSQRIAMFADAIVARPGSHLRERARLDLESSIRTFSQAHHALTKGDPKINPTHWDPPKVREMYFSKPYDVDLQARVYIEHARALDLRARHGTIREDDPDLDYLLNVGPGILLRSLDAVVAAYNAEERASTEKFEWLQIALLFLGLSTLVVIWFTILLPLEREIAERTAAMELAAMTDPLTGALNRKAFDAAVEPTIARTSRTDRAGAMLAIDVDRFKVMNDTYGHAIGDDTIVRVATILRENSRPHDVIARFGGDEFVVFAPAFQTETDLRAFVERLCTALQFDASVPGGTHRVTASIGVARLPADATTRRELLAASDRALYDAKRRGRAQFAFFGEDAGDAATDTEPVRTDFAPAP